MHFSIITALNERTVDMCKTLRESILNQKGIGEGVSWFVQYDGPANPEMRKKLEMELEIASLEVHGFQAGISATRNRALDRALAANPETWVTPVDADDILPADALRIRKEAIGDSTDRWLTTNGSLFEDGNVKNCEQPFEPHIEAGEWDAQKLLERFSEDQFVHLFGNTLTAPGEMIRSVGGWPAVLVAEDLALLVELCRHGHHAIISDHDTYLLSFDGGHSDNDCYMQMFAKMLPSLIDSALHYGSARMSQRDAII